MIDSSGEMKRFLVKSKIGLGRDFTVFDDEEATNKVFKIDAKVGLGSKAEIMDANDKVIYSAKGRVINIPKRMEYLDTNGKNVATATAHFSPIKSHITMEFTGGRKWELKGNFIEKNYQVKEGDKTIIEMNQKWMTVRDKYFVEIASDVDIPLALGLIWAVDVWREGKNN
jgi:uncharacterized protein YxjI